MLYGTPDGDNKVGILFHGSEAITDINGFRQVGRFKYYPRNKQKNRPTVTKQVSGSVAPARPRPASYNDLDVFSSPAPQQIQKLKSLGKYNRSTTEFRNPQTNNYEAELFSPKNNIDNFDILTAAFKFDPDIGMGAKKTGGAFNADNLSGIFSDSLHGLSKSRFKKAMSKATKTVVKVARPVVKAVFILPRLTTASTIRAVGAKSNTFNRMTGITKKEGVFVEKYGKNAVRVAAVALAGGAASAAIKQAATNQLAATLAKKQAIALFAAKSGYKVPSIVKKVGVIASIARTFGISKKSVPAKTPDTSAEEVEQSARDNAIRIFARKSGYDVPQSVTPGVINQLPSQNDNKGMEVFNPDVISPGEISTPPITVSVVDRIKNTLDAGRSIKDIFSKTKQRDSGTSGQDDSMMLGDKIIPGTYSSDGQDISKAQAKISVPMLAGVGLLLFFLIKRR